MFASCRTFLINVISVFPVERLAVKYVVYDLTVITFDKLMYGYLMCVICSFEGRVHNLGGILWLENLILTNHRVERI